MFIGHFAPAFIAATVSPQSPRLGTLFMAAQLLDWGLFGFALVGVENLRVDPEASVMVPLDLYDMPYTHSLMGAGIWALACLAVVAILRRNLVAGALAGAVVLSHWLLDWVVHVPDLTLDGQLPKFGLGLWNYPWVTMPLEIGLTLGAFAFYLRRTRGPMGPPAILLGALLLLQALNWFAPHPETEGPFLYLQALFAFAVLTGLAVWVGENRWFQKRRGLALSPQ